jgi:D-3-phosphoglycerate dehydrogenase
MRLLLATPISPDAIELLQSRHDVVLGFERSEDVGELIADREGLVFRSGVMISRDVIEAADELRLVVRAGSGLDNIDLDAARERGIRVARVPGASPEAVAELTLGLMLAATRNIRLADSLVRQGRWPKHDLGGHLIAGKTMGIVGAGRIGTRVGALCSALGMDVLGCVESPEDDQPRHLEEAGITLTDFASVITEADFVSIHTPLQDSTRNLIDATAIAKMKPGVVLINTARGGVVDESAVFEALTSGHMSAAGFDVHEREGDGVIPRLASLPNVVLTPHIGGMALETQSMIGMRVAEIIEAFLAGNFDGAVTSDEFVV